MRLSIHIRMLVAMNLLVVAVGVIVGWVGIRVSATQIERKLLNEPVSNAAGLVGEMHLPLTEPLMARLRRILGAEVAAGPAETPRIDAASLPAEQAAELAEALGAAGGEAGGAGGRQVPHRVVLGGVQYRLAWAAVAAPGGEAARPMRLYLLVPAERVDAAKREVAGTIAWVTFAAVAAATLLAIAVSAGISRPVRRLARHMDALAGEAAGGGEGDGGPQRTARQTIARGAPGELHRLAESFDRLLDTLADARERLAQATRLATLGKLSASVAHELRNPLSGLRMNAQVLAGEMSEAGLSDSSLDVMLREIDRMDLYLQELLSLGAQPQSRQRASASADVDSADAAGPGDRPGGSPGPASTACRLDEVAESVLALLSGRCGHAGVTVARRFDADAGRIRADEAQVRQVLLNLILNALEAMPAGGGLTLTIAAEGDAVRCAVADTGGGVHLDDGADPFEPFVTSKSSGAGLGLHVCRQIIDRHGGRIGYDSSAEGATFWFDLPAAR